MAEQDRELALLAMGASEYLSLVPSPLWLHLRGFDSPAQYPQAMTMAPWARRRLNR